MLSFDISDRQINIVKGENVGGKIKIDRSCSVVVPGDMIVSGEVVNLSGLADVILKHLRTESMLDKNAIVTFSSNNIVFKELIIPKAKGDQFLTMVQNQMTHEMGITNDFSISYTIVGEAGPENPGSMKVLATACPFAIVESYRKLFGIMGINLRSANISCNSISRIVLADKTNMGKMPLLVVELDPSFLGMTLFENGQMAFARYLPISEDDYESDDYIIEAMSENIFKMTQFNKARGGPGISNVILYGTIDDYIKYADALAQMDIGVSILPVPSQISGYENFEFTVFANAIGALFKRNKTTERINLIEVDTITGRSGGANKQFLKVAGISVAASAILLFAIFILVGMRETKYDDEKKDVMQEIQRVQEEITLKAKQKQILDNLIIYKTSAENALNALNSKPIITQDIYTELFNIAKNNNALNTKTGFESLSYTQASGQVTITNIKFPTKEDLRKFADDIRASELFYAFTYTGWNTETDSPEETKEVVDESGIKAYVIPSMTIFLKEGNAK